MTDHIDWIRSKLDATELSRLCPVQPAPVVTPSFIRVPGTSHEYATMYPGNLDHRAFLLQYANGFIGLHKTDGTLHKMLANGVNTGSQPRWSRKRATCFYYLFLNELRMYDVANDSVTLIRKFTEYPNINGMGESDLSHDGEHLVLCSGSDVFVYNLITDRKVAQFRAPWPFNNLYLTPDNQVIIGFEDEATGGVDHGIHVWDHDKGILRKLAGSLGHMATGRDANGDSIIVWANGGDSSGLNQNAQLANCKNALVKIRVADGRQTCLQQFNTPGWPIALHVAMPVSIMPIQPGKPWCLVSTFDRRNPASLETHANDLLLVALDGTGVTRSLGKHGSNAASYFGQPRAAVSPDGTRICYDTMGDAVIRQI